MWMWNRTFLPNWRNCLNWHVTSGGHGIMKPSNFSETSTLPSGKKWDRTPYFCWSAWVMPNWKRLPTIRLFCAEWKTYIPSSVHTWMWHLTASVRLLPISAWSMVWTTYLRYIPVVWAYLPATTWKRLPTVTLTCVQSVSCIATVTLPKPCLWTASRLPTTRRKTSDNCLLIVYWTRRASRW